MSETDPKELNETPEPDAAPEVEETPAVATESEEITAEVMEAAEEQVAEAIADDDPAPPATAEEASDKAAGARKRRRGKPAKAAKPAKEPRIDKVRAFESKMLRNDIPEFRAGDTVRVFVKIKEGEKERLQAFEGVCIARKHGGVRETFTVRKISAASVGVERTFFLNSHRLDHIERVRKGQVRRAKIYYLRQLRGKAARIKERRD